MRKLIIVGAVLLAMMLTACCQNKKIAEPKLPQVGTEPNYNFTGSKYQQNYVWGGAMNMAWTELAQNFAKGAIELDTKDEATLETLYKLNNPVFGKQDMDEQSYYVKSGYGQSTVQTINKECRKKFPTKSIADLKVELGERDIISYAYFLKEIEYMRAFNKHEVMFKERPVEGFTADAESYKNVRILDYTSDDKFLISLQLKDSKDQIFLGKGYPMDNPDEVVKLLREKAPAMKEPGTELGAPMNKKDVFMAPMLHLDYNRQYHEMMGKSILNKSLLGYGISVMQEIIKFDMDEKGARVENEAVIVVATSAGPGHDSYKPKQLILDKPYWVVMKRFDSQNPYFILGVNNILLMKESK